MQSNGNDVNALVSPIFKLAKRIEFCFEGLAKTALYDYDNVIDVLLIC